MGENEHEWEVITLKEDWKKKNQGPTIQYHVSKRIIKADIKDNRKKTEGLI